MGDIDYGLVRPESRPPIEEAASVPHHDEALIRPHLGPAHLSVEEIAKVGIKLYGLYVARTTLSADVKVSLAIAPVNA